jgi:hypothetical protein
MAGYHELKSDFGGIPRFALPWSTMLSVDGALNFNVMEYF